MPMINHEYYILDVKEVREASLLTLKQLEAYYETLKKDGKHVHIQNMEEHDLIKNTIKSREQQQKAEGQTLQADAI